MTEHLLWQDWVIQWALVPPLQQRGNISYKDRQYSYKISTGWSINAPAKIIILDMFNVNIYVKQNLILHCTDIWSMIIQLMPLSYEKKKNVGRLQVFQESAWHYDISKGSRTLSILKLKAEASGWGDSHACHLNFQQWL